MIVELYTSAFCEPCHLTRAVLADAARLVPAADVHERDIVKHEAEAAADGIRVTPTTIVRDARGTEVFRGEGVPTLPQLLSAFAKGI